jgi:lipopolysaccharide export system permease protein
MTFFISLFILLMQFVWKYVDDLVGKGLEWFIILKLLGLVAITMISLALPLAVLLSSLMTFGNLGEYMELTAMKSSGISLQRGMRSVLVFALMLSVSAFYFSNNLLPRANLRMKTLLQDISNKRPELNIKPGIFNNDIQNYVIRIGKKSNDGKLLEDIMIYDHSNHKGNDRVIIAEQGVMGMSADKQYLELKLVNGNTYTEAEKKGQQHGKFPFLRENFKEDLIRFDLSIFDLTKTDESVYKRNYQMLNLSQLELSADTLRKALSKEKSYLPNVLLHGAFFDSSRTYTTELIPVNKPRNAIDSLNEQEQARKDSMVESASNKLEQRASLTKLMAEGKRDSFRVKSKLDRSSQIVTQLKENSKFIPLKSKTNVLDNFSKSEQKRIVEVALNNIKSNKSTLDYTSQNFEQDQERINRHDIEWHRKFTLSFACIILFLIGAPLGAIVRKGGLGMPVIFSLVFFILYHMISITGEKLSREGVLSGLHERGPLQPAPRTPLRRRAAPRRGVPFQGVCPRRGLRLPARSSDCGRDSQLQGSTLMASSCSSPIR